jgi:2-iminobutanoate/2-iminopropanoate deaminase
MRKYIASGDGLPKWTAPISHAVVVDNICYVSGQLSLDKAGKFVRGSVREQARRAFDNLFAAVRAAGFSVEDFVFIDVAFADLRDLGEVNTLFAELFPEGKRPARTIYQAAALPFGGKVKVMGVAIRERKAG